MESRLRRQGQILKPAYSVREDSTILGMVDLGLGAAIVAHLAT